MVKGTLPSLSEPDVWTGTAQADVWGALRRKHAEIHRGSRRRDIGPLREAGYTSAIAKLEPEPTEPLQSGGVHIHPQMRKILDATKIDRRAATGIEFAGVFCAASGSTNRQEQTREPQQLLATPEGLEPSTPDLEGPCSIQLSYGAARRR